MVAAFAKIIGILIARDSNLSWDSDESYLTATFLYIWSYVKRFLNASFNVLAILVIPGR